VNPRRPRWRRRILAAALAAVLALAAAELAARALLGLGHPPLYVADPAIEYRLRPGQDLRRFGRRFTVNRWGMRSAPLPAAKADPREYRVLVLGDSVVNGGSLTDQSQLATTRLETELADALDRPVRVGNVSCGSWGVPNLLAWADRFGLFGADAAVLVLSAQDAADVPTFAPLDPVTQPTRRPRSALWEGCRRYLLPALGLGRPAPAEGRTEPDEARALVRRDLAALLRLAREAGAQPVVVLHWTRPELESDAPMAGHVMLRNAAREAGALVVETRDAYRRAAAPERPIFRDWIHLNPRGQRALELVLLDALKNGPGSQER
jgi:hypothetical protein